MEFRLNRFLSLAGIASRRKADQLIALGKISVNGKVVFEPGTRVDSEKDEVFFQGERCSLVEGEKIYIALHKPVGFTCSHRAFGDDRLIYELVPETLGRLFSVGRLDRESRGLILLTSDGDFAAKVGHPSTEIEKEYKVTVNAPIGSGHLAKIRGGALVEGMHVRPKKVIQDGDKTLTIILTDGRKREIRVLMENAGLRVVDLLRVRIGKLLLGDLPEGATKNFDPFDLIG